MHACRQNLRSWLYRIRPSVTHEPFSPCECIDPAALSAPVRDAQTCANQLRWRPLPLPSAPTHFLEGLQTICGAGRCPLAHRMLIAGVAVLCSDLLGQALPHRMELVA